MPPDSPSRPAPEPPLDRAAVIRQLARRGLKVTPLVERARLEGFLRAVRPWDTGHRLLRIGGDADGGYLVPDDLEGIAACFSPGVSTVADFESDLAARGIDCFMADRSVDGPPTANPRFHFEKTFLGPVDDEAHMTLEHWMRRCAPPVGDLILQMDIEGAEYGVIVDTALETLRRFRILVVEFHDMHALLERHGFGLIHLCFTKLLKAFTVVHAHPNNCCPVTRFGRLEIPQVMEFTFLRSDRVLRAVPAEAFPHPLDRPNLRHQPDVVLPDCWFRTPSG